MDKISPPVRILAVVIILVGVAGMLAMRTMGGASVDESAPIPLPVKQTATPSQAAPAPTPAAPPKAAEPKPQPAVNPVVPRSGFPVVVDRALRKNEVVVLSLVVPGARVDELAAAEAEAGAKLGGAGFLALNVLNEGVARALIGKLEAVQDPSVLVVTRSGDVAVELAGFVDRETVAQAAANALP